MNLNADFARRAAVHAATLPWVPSPLPGITRRMLDRVGGEVARATSLVRYAPGSRFAPHTHGGGEEFLVLTGTFQDEHGDFPAGTYVRNPPGSSHTPGSATGCDIFVKLRQFAPTDQNPLRIDTRAAAFRPDPARPDIETIPLFSAAHEAVRLERWPVGAAIALPVPAGLEILVLRGGFTEAGEAFTVHDWLRLPPGTVLRATAGPKGADVWVKTGHFAPPIGVPAP